MKTLISLSNFDDHFTDFFDDAGSDHIIFANDGNDIVSGSSGSDDIDGGRGNDILFGDFGQDVLTGGTGNDFLFGGEGNDTLFGDPGSFNERDTLQGGAGADTIFLGGAGKVFYHVTTASLGVDSFALIPDFNFSEGDRIVLTGAPSQYLLAGLPTSIGSAGNFGASTPDIGIYLKVGQQFDLIGVVADVSNTNQLSSRFVFV